VALERGPLTGLGGLRLGKSPRGSVPVLDGRGHVTGSLGCPRGRSLSVWRESRSAGVRRVLSQKDDDVADGWRLVSPRHASSHAANCRHAGFGMIAMLKALTGGRFGTSAPPARRTAHRRAQRRSLEGWVLARVRGVWPRSRRPGDCNTGEDKAGQPAPAAPVHREDCRRYGLESWTQARTATHASRGPRRRQDESHRDRKLTLGESDAELCRMEIWPFFCKVL